MAFPVKAWQNSPATATPLSASAIQDLETRLSAFSALVAAKRTSVIPWRSAALNTGTAQTYLLMENSSTATPPGTTPSALAVVYLDPADIAVSGLTTQYEVEAVLLTNATAPAINFTFGLYPVSAVAGGANANTITIGTVQAGSTVLFSAQALSTRGQASSGVFSAPVAGFYAVGVTLSGSMAANAQVAMTARLVALNA